MTALLPLLFLVQQSAAVRPPDPLDIVRESVERDQSDWRRAKDYTYIERQEERHGAKASSKTFEVTTLYGHDFRRMIARDDKPLSGDEAARERQRWDKAVTGRANESDEKRARREAASEEKRQKERAFVREIPKAYHFTLLGEDHVDGYETWVISATPREDFQPKDPRARALPKVSAKVWIAKKDYVWVKAEINVIQPFRWGLFVASLNPGTVIEFVQARVNNEIWMPKAIHVHLDARLLFKKVDGEYNNSFSGYRKFRTDSRVLPSAPP